MEQVIKIMVQSIVHRECVKPPGAKVISVNKEASSC